MREALTFDDVLIIPKFSAIASRKDVEISCNTSGLPYSRIPIIPANMDSITGSEMAKAMAANGATACIHRFQSIEDNVKMFIDSRYGGTGLSVTPMVSIGLGQAELDRASALYDHGASCFVIDVAHGASTSVVGQVVALREIIKDNGSIIVGNFATGGSVQTFLEYHTSTETVDGIKVGIGPGSLCKTREVTGCGYPQLSAIMDISLLKKRYGFSLIADGGMKKVGDIAKALGAGADAVMSGSFFAGTDETPGVTVEISRTEKFKRYRGSASKESYEDQGKEASWRTPEGESLMVPRKGPVKDVLQEIEAGLRSAFSYVGACNLQEFHDKVEFVRISGAGYIEGTPYGKK